MAIAPKQVGKVLQVADFPTPGADTLVLAGTASMEQHRQIVFNQTTAGVTLTLPDPVDPSLVFGLDLVNAGTEDLVLALGTTLDAGKALRITWDGTIWSQIGGAGQEIVRQVAHGFGATTAVRFSGGAWVEAQANAGTNVAHGIVTKVIDADTFVVVTHGKAVIPAHSLTVDEYWWLDQASAGSITPTQPTSGVVQQLLYVRDANTISINICQALSI